MCGQQAQESFPILVEKLAEWYPVRWAKLVVLKI